MLCLLPTVSYVCSNATGTTCTKKTVTLLLPSASVSPCPTGEILALQQSEFDAATVSPWNMTPVEAGQIGGAILLVWAGAWAFRTIVRLMAPDSSDIGHDQ